MAERNSGDRGVVVPVMLATMLSVGCAYSEGTPIVTGVMHRDASVELTKQFVLIRAVPDRREGFEVSRDYRGERVFEDGCPTSHLQFPFAYMLVGDQDHVDGTEGVRWRFLAWETDNPDATWVRPGEAYGTVAFHFADDQYGSFASDVDVVIDRIAP